MTCRTPNDARKRRRRVSDRSFATDVLHPRLASVTHRLVFGGIAGTLLLADLISQLSTLGTTGWRPYLPMIVVETCCLSVAGFFPALGGLAFLASIIISDLATIPVTAPTIGAYLVFAGWISRGWWLASVLGFVVTVGAELAAFHAPTATLIGATIGFSFSVGAGLLWERQRARGLHQSKRINELQEEARQALERARQEHATILHDSVVRDLVRISLISNARRLNSADAEEWSTVGDLSLNAMGTLRDMAQIHGAETNEKPRTTSESPATVIEHGRTLLSSRGIGLISAGDSLQTIGLGEPGRSVLSATLWEAVVNAGKYAEPGTNATVEIGVDDNEVSLSVTNFVGKHSNQDRSTSGGFGLSSLHRRAASTGGTLSYWGVDDKWILTLNLPLKSSPLGKGGLIGSGDEPA